MEFGDPIVGTTELIREAIQSPNYEAGIAGWIIRRDGTAEFQDIIVRGDIVASELDINNTVFGGEDRGRLRAFFDSVNLNQQLEWRIGQQNIDDFITGGTPSGASQTSPAEIRHEVRGTEGPELELNSGQFNAQGSANISIFGKAWDGSAEAGISLTPAIGGAVFISNSAALVATRMRHEHLETATDLVHVGTGNWSSGDGLIPFTGTYPQSGVITVTVYFRGSIDVANGIIGMLFEIRDTNAAGTLRYDATANGSKRAEFRHPTASTTASGTITQTVDGLPTSGTMFIRPMYIATNAANATYAHRTMELVPSP